MAGIAYFPARSWVVRIGSCGLVMLPLGVLAIRQAVQHLSASRVGSCVLWLPGRMKRGRRLMIWFTTVDVLTQNGIKEHIIVIVVLASGMYFHFKNGDIV